MLIYAEKNIVGNDKNIRFKNVGWVNVVHRGYNARATMNTIEAFYEGLLDNCPAFECDVRETSDGILVLSHDETITGVSDNTGERVTLRIDTSTYEQLKDLTLMTSSIYGKIKIPTLDETLTFAYYHNMIVAIDMKTGSTSYSKIAESVIRNGMSGKCQYNTNSSDITIAKNLLLVDPKASFHFAYTDDISTKFNDLNVIDKSKIIITLSADTMSNERMDNIRKLGFTSYIWNINNNTYKTAISYRPDFLEFVTGVSAAPLDKQTLDNVNF